MLARAADWGIAGYRRWISPRKGWSCAHRVLHGGPGCSGYAQAAIREHGVVGALPLIRARFADCHAAAVTLRRRKGRGAAPQPSPWYGYTDCAGCCDLPCGRGRGGCDPTPDGCDGTPDCTPDCCGH